MLVALLTVIHVVVSLGLILVVLLQSGKGGGLAGSIGGGMGGAQVAFGGRGTADILSKSTTVLAISFMVLSLAMTVTTMKTSTTQGQSKLREMLNQEAREVTPFNPTPIEEKIESPETQSAPTVTPSTTVNDSN